MSSTDKSATRRRQQPPRLKFDVCQIKGCDRAHEAHAFCRLHYERWLKHGHPLKTLKETSPEKTLKGRFYSQVDLPDKNGCMLWTGPLVHGYGTFSFGGKRVYSHRLSYELLVGPIPDGLELDHVWARGCKSRACCNPEHLEPVTPAENKRRGNGVGGINARKSHCVNGHPFDEANTYIHKHGGRQCRACRRDWARKNRPRNKDAAASEPRD